MTSSLHTNSHVHSPYSFSAYSSIEQMVDAAVKDSVKVLGINDFYSTKGFSEFSALAQKNKIYPLLNIEFLVFMPELHRIGIRVNDPTNPGRMYFVGKGLNSNATLSTRYSTILQNSIIAQHEHIKKIIERVNEFFSNKHGDSRVSYDEIKTNHGRDFIGERHVAGEIKRIFNISDMTENEIRNKILKRGGSAFVEESSDVFLSIDDSIGIIRDAGGLPCYPVLLDDKSGQMTEYERDFERLHDSLCELGVRHLDVIPDRNSIENVKKFVDFFDKKGFFILMGTEHNTHEMKRSRVTFQNGVDLDERIVEIAYRGCCSIAAHSNGYHENEVEIGDRIIKLCTV